MKASREETFRPVTIILETQEEVDGIYALMDDARLSRAAGIPSSCSSGLADFINEDKCFELASKIATLTK